MQEKILGFNLKTILKKINNNFYGGYVMYKELFLLVVFIYMFSSLFWGIFCAINERERYEHRKINYKKVWLSFFINFLFMPIGLVVAFFRFENNHSKYNKIGFCKNCGKAIRGLRDAPEIAIHFMSESRLCDNGKTLAEWK